MLLDPGYSILTINNKPQSIVTVTTPPPCVLVSLYCEGRLTSWAGQGKLTSCRPAQQRISCLTHTARHSLQQTWESEYTYLPILLHKKFKSISSTYTFNSYIKTGIAIFISKHCSSDFLPLSVLFNLIFFPAQK